MQIITLVSKKYFEEKNNYKEGTPEFFNQYFIEQHKLNYLLVRYLVLFINSEFILIEYNDSTLKEMRAYNVIDFSESIIDFVFSKIKDVKKELVVNTSRSNRLIRDFKITKNKEKFFLNTYTEINYTYFDNANKEYALVSQIDFPDFFENLDTLSAKKQKAIAIVNENILFTKRDKEDIITQINSLYFQNLEFLRIDKSRLVTSSIDDIIKIIKNNDKN